MDSAGISFEGKIGIALGLVGLLGAGAIMVAPGQLWIGWSLIGVASVGLIALLVHHFRARLDAWLAVAGVLLVAIIFWVGHYRNEAKRLVEPTAIPLPISRPLEAPRPPVSVPIRPGSVVPPTPPPSWVTEEEIQEQKKLGRNLLAYSPAELAQMTLSKGPNVVATYLGNWIKVHEEFLGVVVKEETTQTIRVRIHSNFHYWYVFFSIQEYSDRILRLREGQYLDAYCKFTKMGKPTDAAQVFANILEFQGTDCELH